MEIIAVKILVGGVCNQDWEGEMFYVNDNPDVWYDAHQGIGTDDTADTAFPVFCHDNRYDIRLDECDTQQSVQPYRHCLRRCSARRAADRACLFYLLWYPGGHAGNRFYKFQAECITGWYDRAVHELWRVYG